MCDGCALGVAGFHDWTLSGVHLCTTRLNLLRTNTMGALDHSLLADVAPLRRLRNRELRDLGRLAHPMVRYAGEPGFTQVSWDEALDLIAARIRATTPDRLAVYLTARGITNETYYVAQKFTRFLGTNNIDNAARVCHAPSTTTLKKTIGVAATTCSYTDVINSDLIVLFGANVANAQPVFMKYLYLARKRGAKVAVVNPLREPGLDRYWVPSNVESAMFGTHMTDEFFAVNTGGDLAFLNGVLKVMLAEGTVDREFVRDHTDGFDDVVAELDRESFADLERQSGATRADMERFARMYADAPSAVLIWSMGITQHEHGADNVAAIVNLGLARGNVGRPGAGLMPIRGHSGVQGGAEMGAYATALPGGLDVNAANAAALAERYGFPVGDRPGITAEEMVEAGGRGEIDVLVLVRRQLPRGAARARGGRRRARCACRCGCTRTSSSPPRCSPSRARSSCSCPRPPATSRHGGGTETTTERRIAYSPEIPGPRPGEVRSEWEIFVDLARRVAPERAEQCSFASGQEIRDEIARVVPRVLGRRAAPHHRRRDPVGRHPTVRGRDVPHAGRPGALPRASRRPRSTCPRGASCSARGAASSSTRWCTSRRIRSPARRVTRSSWRPSDIEGLGLRDGDRVVVRSDHGEMRARLHASPLRPGNVQVFFPEGNVLLRAGRRDPASGVPDYNAVVTVEAASR